MVGPNRFFEDAARVAGGAVDSLAGLRREAEVLVRHQMDRILSNMDLVTRDEFEAVKEMATKARLENEYLKNRLIEIEDQLSTISKKSTRSKRSTSPNSKASGKGRSVKTS